MPIINGRYEAKIGTTYKIGKGIEEIKRKIRRSRVIKQYSNESIEGVDAVA